jgi:glycosyltransferase involved in cell wall biosynthesis
MKRILLLTGHLPPYFNKVGGINRVLTMASYFADHGYAVHTLSVSTGKPVNSVKTSHKGVSSHFVKDRSRSVLDGGLYHGGGLEYAKLFLQEEGLRIVPVKLLNYIASILLGDSFFLLIRAFYLNATRLVEEQELDTIIISSPPHALNLVGLLLKRKFGNKLKVIIDYRDSWTTRGVRRRKNFVSKFFMKYVEQSVLDGVDNLVVVSEGMRGVVLRAFPDPTCELSVVMNGYDDITGGIDYSGSKPKAQSDSKITIGYFGGGSTENGNASDVSKVFKLLVNNSLDQHISFKVVGKYEVGNETRRKYQHFSTFCPQVPHAEAVDLMKTCDYLAVIYLDKTDAEEQLSGKIFDYIAVGKPILVFGVRELVGLIDIIDDNRFGMFVDIEDEQEFAVVMSRIIESGAYEQPPHENRSIRQFSRSHQYSILEKIIEA